MSVASDVYKRLGHGFSDGNPCRSIKENAEWIYDLLKELKAKDAEFIIVLKAFDESFSQIVYSRTSYKTDEIRWGEKFNYIIEQNEDGIIVDASRLDESSKAELN